jgi:hypothetical protein
VAAARRFSRRLLGALAAAKYVKIRSGATHRFIGVWVVVVGGRVFVRSWYNKRDGWQRAFLDEPRGAIELDGREIRIRAMTGGGSA